MEVYALIEPLVRKLLDDIDALPHQHGRLRREESYRRLKEALGE